MEGKTIPFYLVDRDGNKTLLSSEICKANFLVLSDSPLLEAISEGNSSSFTDKIERFYAKIRQVIPEENIDDIIELIEESVLDTDSKKELFNTTITTERATFLAFVFLFYNNKLTEIEEILSPDMTFESRSGKIIRALHTDPDSSPSFYKILFPQLETLLDNVITDYGTKSDKVFYKYGFNSPHGESSLPFFDFFSNDYSTDKGRHRNILANNNLLYPYNAANALCSTVDWHFKIDFKWWEFFIPLYNWCCIIGGTAQAAMISSAKYVQNTFFKGKNPNWLDKVAVFASWMDQIKFNYHSIVGGTMSFAFFRNVIKNTFPKRNDFIQNTDFTNDLENAKEAVLEGFKRSSNSYFDHLLNEVFGIERPRGRKFNHKPDVNFYPSFLEQLADFITTGNIPQFESTGTVVFPHSATEAEERNGLLRSDVTIDSSLTLNGYIDELINCNHILKLSGFKFQEQERYYLLETLFRKNNNHSNSGPKAILDAGVSYAEDGNKTYIASFSSTLFKDAFYVACANLEKMIRKPQDFNLTENERSNLTKISSFSFTDIENKDTTNTFLNAYYTMLVKAMSFMKPTDIHLGISKINDYSLEIIKRTLNILFRIFLTSFLTEDELSTEFRATLSNEDEDIRKISRTQFAINKIYSEHARSAFRSLFTRTDDKNYDYLEFIRSNGTLWNE